jgi:hypothetical protein
MKPGSVARPEAGQDLTNAPRHNRRLVGTNAILTERNFVGGESLAVVQMVGFGPGESKILYLSTGVD